MNQYADDFQLYRAYYPCETFSCKSFTQDIVTEAVMDIFQMASVEPDEDAVYLARHILGALHSKINAKVIKSQNFLTGINSSSTF